MIRQLLVFTIAAIVPGASFAAPEPAEAAKPGDPDQIVRLSPYEVSANSVDFQQWVKIGSPHFIIYTDASVEDAMRLAGEFERLHLATAKYFSRPSFRRSPAIVVLPTSRSDWHKLESSLAVEWHVAVSQPTHRLRELIVAQYDWQSWLQGTRVLYAALGWSEFHGMKLEGPLWFGYGIGTFFETVKFTNDTVILGKQSARARAMWLRGWLPWPDFFKATSTSPEFTRGNQIAKYSGQSAAFVNFLLTNPEPVWRDRLMRWAALLQAGREPTEEEFKGVFGQDWEAWQATMKHHIHDRSDRTASIRLTAEELAFVPTRLELPVREMRELFVLAQILNQKIPASETALDLLLAKGLKTESLRELLAEACVKWKRPDAARDHLRMLIATGSGNPGAYVLAAENLFRSRLAATTLQGRLGGEADEIRALCRKALAIEPLYPDAHNLLAWADALGPSVEPENIVEIERSSRALSGVAPMQEVACALAIAQWRAGNSDPARSLGQTLLNSPYANKKSREIATALLAELGPAP